MAKTLQTTFAIAKNTAYTNGNGIMVSHFAANTIMRITPLQKPNGANTNAYALQRLKRVKGQDVANPNANTTAANLAALDGFSTMDWDTVAIVTGNLKSIGLKVGINEVFDVNQIGDAQAQLIAGIIENQAVERAENIVAELRAGKGTTTNNIVVGSSDKISEKITEAFGAIEMFADDYKYMSNKVVAFINPIFADKLAQEVGTTYSTTAPTLFGTGLADTFSILGRSYAKTSVLNSITGATATDGASANGKRLIAIVVDSEAVAMLTNEYKKGVDIDMGLTRFVGDFHYDVIKLVDTNRVKFIWGDAPSAIAATVKVNA